MLRVQPFGLYVSVSRESCEAKREGWAELNGFAAQTNRSPGISR